MAMGWRSQATHKLTRQSYPVTSEHAEQGRVRRWGTRQTLSAIAVGAAIGGLGGAAIYAATQGSAHTVGGMRAHVQGPPPPPAPGVPRPPQPVPAGVLHSEYVVSDGHGGFITKMTQTGIVDEITLSSVVVRSDDGYTQIYTFPSAAVVPNPSVAANDTVTVEAARTGATITLNSIAEGPPHGN
jgi:hypothetical protein